MLKMPRVALAIATRQLCRCDTLTQQHSVRISAIGGWEPTSVGAEMKKAGFNQSDIDAVAKLFEDAMPNFAAEIKKQIPRQTKSRK